VYQLQFHHSIFECFVSNFVLFLNERGDLSKWHGRQHDSTFHVKGDVCIYLGQWSKFCGENLCGKFFWRESFFADHEKYRKNRKN